MFNDYASPPTATLPPPAVVQDTHERILLAVGDARLRPLLVDLLTGQGYRILEAGDQAQAFDIALHRHPPLAIFDLSDFDAAALLPRLRDHHATVAILVLAPDDDARHRIDCLTRGADDCLGQPFHPAELLARVRALLRRQAPPVPASPRLDLDDIVIDLERMTVRRQGELIRLSRTECSILDLLAKNRGFPVSRTRMLDVVWGYTYLPNTRTLDTHIWRLRKKLGDTGDHPRWLVNVPGVGYRLEAARTTAAV